MSTLIVQPQSKAQEDVLIALAETWQIKCEFLNIKKLEDDKIAAYFLDRKDTNLLTEIEAEIFLQKLG